MIQVLNYVQHEPNYEINCKHMKNNFFTKWRNRLTNKY